MNHVDLLTHVAQFYGYVRDSPHIGRMFVEKEEEGWYGPHCCFECGALLQNQGFGWPLWLSRPGLQDINFCSLPCLIEICLCICLFPGEAPPAQRKIVQHHSSTTAHLRCVMLCRGSTHSRCANVRLCLRVRGSTSVPDRIPVSSMRACACVCVLCALCSVLCALYCVLYAV